MPSKQVKEVKKLRQKTAKSSSSSSKSSRSSSRSKKNMKTQGDKFPAANHAKQKNEFQDQKLAAQTKKEQAVPQVMETVKTAVPATKPLTEQIPTAAMKIKTTIDTTPMGSGQAQASVAEKRFEKVQTDKEKQKMDQIVPPRISSSRKRINTQLIDKKKSYEEDHLMQAGVREANQAYLSAQDDHDVLIEKIDQKRISEPPDIFSSAFAQGIQNKNMQQMGDSQGLSDASFYKHKSSMVENYPEIESQEPKINTIKSTGQLGQAAANKMILFPKEDNKTENNSLERNREEEDDYGTTHKNSSKMGLNSSKDGYKNSQDFNQKSTNSLAGVGGGKRMTRTSTINRFKTTREPDVRNNKGGNPYLSNIFKENELLTASNAYHRLDKNQNFLGNKAFACTIINDLKQRQRQEEFEKRIGVTDSNTASKESSRMHTQASREHFKKQQDQIYNSQQVIRVGKGQDGSSQEIQNLKEVLSYSSARQGPVATSTAYSTQKKGQGQSSGGLRAENEYFLNFELPADAAQRWMSNAQFQASQSMLRKHGGNYLDTKTPPLPVPRSISAKVIDTHPIGHELSQIESSHDDNGRINKETISSSMEKSMMKQKKELKRIMQSQKSLANATNSIVKLMKIHDHTSQWSVLDVKKNVSTRTSANFVNTRLITNDPKNFSRPSSSSQFRVKGAQGSLKTINEIYVDGGLVPNKRESNYLNQQSKLFYLKSTSAGMGGGSANVTGLLRPSTCTDFSKAIKPQPMNTNLNAVLRTNPESFYPRQVASINFASTDYNFINFQPNKSPAALVQTKPGANKSVSVIRKDSNPVGSAFTGAPCQRTQPPFYKGYHISSYAQECRPMAPNYHPEHIRNLAENQKAFFIKTGFGAGHLDDARTAVERKSNKLLENSRMVPSGSHNSSSHAAGTASVR